MTAISITDLNNAKTDVDHIADISNSVALTATDRLGNVKDTLTGAMYKVSTFNSRGAWVTATAYAIKDLVSNAGTWYVCMVAHTSSAAFATDTATKWRVYQGVIAGDLAAPGGSSGIGYMPAGAGAVATTVQAKLRECVSVFDKMTSAQQADVLARTRGLDITAATQVAVDDILSRGGGRVVFPAGSYNISTINGAVAKYITLEGDNQAGTVLYATATGAIAASVFNFAVTAASSYINIEKIGFVGNGLTGAAGNGHALRIVNATGGGYAPQIVSLKDVYVTGFVGNGADNAGAALPSCGVYGYLGASLILENVALYSCARGLSLNAWQKVSGTALTIDTCTGASIHLLNCENINFFGGVLNDGGSGGAADGNVVLQGNSNVNFYGTRLKNGNPANVQTGGTTYLNNDINFNDCHFNQLSGLNPQIIASTGDSNLHISGGTMKWANTTTAGVGVLVNNGAGGYTMTGFNVSKVTYSIGSGGTILAMVSMQNTTQYALAPEFDQLTWGDGSASASATNMTNGILLNGIVDSPIIRSPAFVVSTNQTLTNGVNFASANSVYGVVENPTFRNVGGTITNQVVNSSGSPVKVVYQGKTKLSNNNSTAGITGMLAGTAAWTPGAIANGASVSAIVAVSSATFGDLVMCGYSSALAAGLSISGAVTGAGQITVTISNTSGGSITPAAGTVNVFVMRAA